MLSLVDADYDVKIATIRREKGPREILWILAVRLLLKRPDIDQKEDFS